MADAEIEMFRLEKGTLDCDKKPLSTPDASLGVAWVLDVVLTCLVSKEYKTTARVPAKTENPLLIGCDLHKQYE